MLRDKVESVTGQLTDIEFKVMCAVVTADIKFNRFGMGKKTSLADVLDIARNSKRLIKNMC